jgi:hypothetical protein
MPKSPSSAEPKSQAAAGMGTVEIDPEKLVDVIVDLVSNRSVRDVGLVN